MKDIYVGSLFSEAYLEHHGILGMKWGVRRFENKDGSLTYAGKKRYRSTGLRSYIARKRNEKVDKSFKRWRENSEKRESAIELGKKANVSRMAYESDRSNKEAKKQYKLDNKAYKKALRSNTTYRKGQIRAEVGQDISRKYLTEAKRVGKQLEMNPNDRALQKRYNRLMSAHDIERDRARKAPAVGAARSRRIASLKRAATMSVKTAVISGVLTIGAFAINRYGNFNISGDTLNNVVNVGKKIMRAARYAY